MSLRNLVWASELENAITEAGKNEGQESRFITLEIPLRHLSVPQMVAYMSMKCM